MVSSLDDIPYNVLATEAYIIYLRKSRADSPTESVEEVLAKHETMLQDMAVRELGGRIPEHCIFREVVSGETISERPQMQAVMAAIENPAVKMVLVVEPSRLSRGDLVDCGNVVNAFRYSNTKIMTTQMTYDLQNKMHRKFFEQELLRGNDFLEYTKEILYRGRVASAQKGYFIGNHPPFGYDRAEIDGGPSLKPNENADLVRKMFDLYVNEDRSYTYIARYFESVGAKTQTGSPWRNTTIRSMLENIHYIGMIKFGERETTVIYEDGQLVKKRTIREDSDGIVISKGKHQAIVSQEIFDLAREKKNRNPRQPKNKGLVNVMAGMLVCAKCQKSMVVQTYQRSARTRVTCRYGCGSRSVMYDEVVETVIQGLEQQQLPLLEAKLKNNDGNSAIIQQRSLKKLREDLDKLKQQETKQYELLEKEIYTEDVFMERNKALHIEMDELKSKIYEISKNTPKEIDYNNKIVSLKEAISALRNDDISNEEKNKLLKKVIDKIEYEYISYEGRAKVKFNLNVHLLI